MLNVFIMEIRIFVYDSINWYTRIDHTCSSYVMSTYVKNSIISRTRIKHNIFIMFIRPCGPDNMNAYTRIIQTYSRYAN